MKSEDARLYYLQKAREDTWSKRELRQQIQRKAFERKEIAKTQLKIPQLLDLIRQPPIAEEQEPTTPKMTLKEAFDFGLKLKEKLLSNTTKRTYENRIKNFLKWVAEEHPENTTIDKLEKKLVKTF